jgi:hypothetical protein
VRKCAIARQVIDDNIIQRMRFACWITKATDMLWACYGETFISYKYKENCRNISNCYVRGIFSEETRC